MAELIKTISKSWFALALVMTCSIVVAILEMITLTAIAPLLSNQNYALTDRLPSALAHLFQFINSMNWSQKLSWIAFVLVVATIVKNFVVWLNIIIASKLREVVVKVYRMRCIDQLMRVGISYINRQRLSDLQQMVEIHIDNSVGVIIDAFVMVMPQVVTLLLLVLFLFKMSIALTISAVILVGFSSIWLGFLSRRIRQQGTGHVKERNVFSHIVSDILYGMKIIRLFGRERFLTKKFEDQCNVYHRSFARMMRSTAMVAPIFETCGIIIIAVLLIISANIWGNNSEFKDILLVFFLIWIRIIPPVKAINQTRAMIIARIPALKEVEHFFKESSSQYLPSGTSKFTQLKNNIVFDHVGFRYQSHLPVVICDLSFELKRGQRLGIVGASGSGKSTVSELLLRFYDPQQGQIRVDGQDLKEIDINSWRRAIGVVTQDVFLFHDSIRNNIAFGNLDASEDDIIRAAKCAHAHDFIMAMPGGYDTRVGDRGVLLSGGQRQRIAIARAILNEPQILIFDEATSALDSESEKIIQHAIEEISQERTVILIAHRLSTIEKCDYIIVLKDGSIQEQGIPQQLWDSDGYFKRLITLQGATSFNTTKGS